MPLLDLVLYHFCFFCFLFALLEIYKDSALPVSWDLSDDLPHPDESNTIEGDIMSTPDLMEMISEEEEKSQDSEDGESSRTKRDVIHTSSSLLWPDGVVPYVFGMEVVNEGEQLSNLTH